MSEELWVLFMKSTIPIAMFLLANCLALNASGIEYSIASKKELDEYWTMCEPTVVLLTLSWSCLILINLN